MKLSVVRSWALGNDTATVRAIRRARPWLTRVTDPEIKPWAALSLSRLARVEPVPQARRALEQALRVARDEAVRARILVELAAHESDLERAAEYAARGEHGGDADVTALARLRLARIAQRRGDLSEASAILRGVRGAGEDVRASVDVVLGMQAIAEGRSSDALTRFDRAFRWAVSEDADIEASEIAGMIGNTLHALGDLAPALRWYSFAVRHATRAGATTIAAIFELYRGWARHETGNRAAAAKSYAIALRGAAVPCFELHASALSTLLGKGPERQAKILRIAADLERRRDQARARAVTTMALGASALEAARDVSAPLTLLRLGPALAFEPTSDDERIALRMARADFARALARAARHKARLRMALDGSKCRVGARKVSLAKNPTLARLLVSVATATLEGRAATTSELVSAGWPGERIRADAAKHRVQVAVSTLRKRGIEIERGPRGYAIACSLGLMPN